MTFKLLTYTAEDGKPRAGILVDNTVYDAARSVRVDAYATVLGILDDWRVAEKKLAAAAKTASPKEGIPLANVKLLAPVLYPGQIFAAGANYQDHIAEMTRGPGTFPAVNAKESGGRAWHFSKSSRSAVVGPGTVRPLPPYSSKVDWELELAVIMGTEAKNVSPDQALRHVAGYTIANDLSARDFVAREGTPPGSPFYFDWIAHKGFDGSCPMGPWITLASDIPDPQTLGMKLWVERELKQDSNTRYMIFSVAEQIAELSSRVTLHPGDVILTGTPAGAGMGSGVFLKAGQSLRLWIENIGELHHGFS